MIVATQGVANAGACIRADIDEPIRLPDGNIHDAGTLRLCHDRDYSPVASLHLAFIDNESIGMVTSRRESSEGEVDSPFMMFARRKDGLLELYGYALPSDGNMSTYRLQAQPRRTAPLTVAARAFAVGTTTTIATSRIPARVR